LDRSIKLCAEVFFAPLSRQFDLLATLFKAGNPIIFKGSNTAGTGYTFAVIR
jgi:hypothetical protein